MLSFQRSKRVESHSPDNDKNSSETSFVQVLRMRTRLLFVEKVGSFLTGR